jgi:iron complex transport system ATP-binding protein
VVKFDVQNLSVGYGVKVLVHDLSLTADRGIHVILGPNGSGKSTLLNAISGLTRPLSGSVEIDGVRMETMSARDIARRVAYVHQDYHLSFGFTVEDLVLMGRTPHINHLQLPSARDRGIASETMERIGIAHLRQRRVTELSGGERKLVLIGMALCQQTDVLLLDEPTSSLDIKHALEILGLLRHLSEQAGLVIFMSVHDVNLAAAFADDVLLLFGGACHLRGAPVDVLTKDNLHKLYGVRFQVVQVNTSRSFAIPLLEPE